MPDGSGLRVDEERGPEQSIARLDCARAAFVGRTLRGPVNQPVLIRAFAEFQHLFGGLWQPSPLGYSVEHFFDNGGREAVIVRIVNRACAATITLPAGSGALTLRAVRPGTREFLRVSVDYDNIAAADSTEFNLTVQRVRAHGTEQVDDQEIFPRLSMSPDAERYVPDAIATSDLVQLEGPLPSQRPNQTLDAGSGLAIGYANSNTDGDDGAPLTDYDVIGSEVDHTGLFALDTIEYFNLLCIPPLSRDQDIGPGVLWVAERYCRNRRAMLIVDPPAAWQTADDALRGMHEWSFFSQNAVMYFPRILVHDKLRGQFEPFAPCGAVAGTLARSDEGSPVWGPVKADETILRPGYRPGCLVPDDKRLRLAAVGVNTLQAVRSPVRTVIPPRTLAAGSAATSDWQRLAARRLALFIVNSVERGTRWVMFTKPHAEVAELAEVQIKEFFAGLHAVGAFGSRPLSESFFVVCDHRVNPTDGVVPNAFHILMGFAAGRPREFHSYRISHSAAGTQVMAVSLNLLTMNQADPADHGWVTSPQASRSRR